MCNLQPILLDIVGAVDIRYFVMARRRTLRIYMIGFVEGAVTSPRELMELKKSVRSAVSW